MLFVFMSQPDFACNPHALYEYIKRETEHETAWIVKRKEHYDNLRERGIRCALYNTLSGNELLGKADYVVTNSYTFLNLPKKKHQIFVNLWHGSGIKAHDFYHHDMPAGQVKKLETFFGLIDLMCVHSLDDRFKLSAMLHYDLRRCYVTGQARLDCVCTSDGPGKLMEIYGSGLEKYEKFIFFAPSFRANMSSHSGTIFSDNIFRLADYDDERLCAFLERHRAALIYKLHPIEQTAFSGRQFCMNQHCFALTDELLFEHDIRYDELLNAFDLMISDYSSIAFDFLLLNRPIVYLIPDYEEYSSQRGFVFHRVDSFMPGEKAHCFEDMMSALENGFEKPDQYEAARDFVLTQRFDFEDQQSAKRCYEVIMAYKPFTETVKREEVSFRQEMPTTAKLLEPGLPRECGVIDSVRKIPAAYSVEAIERNRDKMYLYITEELPASRELRPLTGQSSAEIADIAYYYDICRCPNVKVCHVTGGVDYGFFSRVRDTAVYKNGRRRIGFAGVIDNRIYFAMVQCICEVFSDCDVIFAGEIFGSFPIWLNGFDNLHYVPASYEELPVLIQSFDVALLPFFGRHRKTIPKEYFQYLACGKRIIASNMPNLPDSKALYRSKSVEEAVEQVREVLQEAENRETIWEAQEIARQYDWRRLAERIMKDGR